MFFSNANEDIFEDVFDEEEERKMHEKEARERKSNRLMVYFHGNAEDLGHNF